MAPELLLELTELSFHHRNLQLSFKIQVFIPVAQMELWAPVLKQLDAQRTVSEKLMSSDTSCVSMLLSTIVEVAKAAEQEKKEE